MRRIGEILIVLGAVLGAVVALAIIAHLGPASSWLINVALAKLTLIAAGGLMGAGAVAIRIDNRDREKRLPPSTESDNPKLE